MHDFIIIIIILILQLSLFTLLGQCDVLNLLIELVILVVAFLLNASKVSLSHSLDRYFTLFYDLIGQVLQVKARDALIGIIQSAFLDRAQNLLR